MVNLKRRRVRAGYRDMEFGMLEMFLRYLYSIVDRVTEAVQPGSAEKHTVGFMFLVHKKAQSNM
jgi:hypothetical protein